MSLSERREMVEHGHELSLVRQSALLGLHRSGLYYRAAEAADEDLVLMALPVMTNWECRLTNPSAKRTNVSLAQAAVEQLAN